jgi:uncharacterized membrane protein YeiH
LLSSKPSRYDRATRPTLSTNVALKLTTSLEKVTSFHDAKSGDIVTDLMIGELANYNITAIIGGRLMMGIFVCGTFVFGLSGGLAGARKHLDVFGVIVLSGIVGLSGGVIRDVFLGIPAVAIFDWRVVASVFLAGIVAFLAHRPLLKLHHPIQILDAIGLSLFSVIGADVSLIHHSGLLPAALLGMATGVFGGAVRDIVVNEVPQVLRAGLYAIPSLMASGLVVLGFALKELSLAWYAMAATVCLVVRLAGIFFDVNLPHAK